MEQQHDRSEQHNGEKEDQKQRQRDIAEIVYGPRAIRSGTWLEVRSIAEMVVGLDHTLNGLGVFTIWLEMDVRARWFWTTVPQVTAALLELTWNAPRHADEIFFAHDLGTLDKKTSVRY